MTSRIMEELSISNESDHSEIARIVQYNHHIRQVIRDQIERFLTLKSDLIEHLQRQQINENPIIQNNGTFFDTVQIESLNEQVTSPKIQLALVGPNSCGKTTLLHFLLRSGNFLPTDVGPVSARIVQLTYADAENAVLYVYQSLTERQILEQVSLTEYFVNRQEPNWDGMKTAIKDHVARPDATNVQPDSDEFAVWAKCFVEIRIPSTFLKLGIDIYDTPGLLFSDASVLKDNLCQLVKLVKPTLVFLYDNPSVNSDTRDCFLAVKGAIGPLADVSMFFLNTKADIERILADADPNNLGIDDKQIREIFSKERQKRYQLLLNVPSIMSEFPVGLPNSIVECSYFDIVSVYSDLDELAAELNQTTINRIIQFTANADLRIARKMSQLVLPMIDAFFDLVLSTNHRTIPQFRKILSEAIQWTENYYDKYRNLIEQLLIELYNNIIEQLDSEVDQIARRAAQLQSNNLIDDYIKTAVQQDIIKIQIKKIRRKYTNSMLLDDLTDMSLLKIAQKNEFLIAAQRHSNWLFESQIKSLDKRSTRQIFAEQTVLAQILLITDILIESNDRDPQRPSLSKYNQLFNRKSTLGRDILPLDFARERLKEVSVWLVDQKTYINEIIDTGYYVEKTELIKKIYQYYHLAEKSLEQRKKLHKLVKQYSKRFALIQCKIISILNLAKSNGKIPIIDQAKNEFLIKQTSDCLEVHYHLRMNQLTIPNILPLVNLYEDEKNNSYWMFFPKHFHKLSEANLTINNVFEIAYDLADSLSHLHFHEIVHGDIQVENIFLDDANQCYLANLYYNRERQSTIHEDIYAFGQLGKFLHEKIISNRDLIISGEDFENLKKLEELFHACGHSDVRLRPSAIIMTDNLRKILETNREIKRQIQTFINEYQNYQIDFIKELHAIPKTSNLEDEYDFKNFSLDLEHQFTFDHVQLAVCGPNGSGKSSFIHSFLQIGAILPAAPGLVTARIVKLTHAPANKACLKVYPSISTGLAEEQTDVHLNLSQFFEQKTNPNWAGIRNEIKIHLERPTDLSEDDFNKWAKCYVEIRIPSPVLELGIDVYDTPGFLFYDKLVLKQNLFELVQTVKPLLIFMYENPSVANDAYDCFLALQSTLGNSVQSAIFFLNSKQDIKTLFDGAGINVSQRHLFTGEKFHEILPNEREKRLNLLLNHKVMRNYLHRDKTVQNFEICSIPISRSILPQCANHMTELAILRIIQFAVRMDLERPYAIMNKILDSIDSFFQFSLTTSHRDPDQWKKIRQDAQAWGVAFFRKSKQEISIQIETAYFNILRYFDQCSANISERAIKIDRTNDPLQLKAPQISKFIEIAVQEEVIKVAVNEIINLAKEALRLSITHEIAVNSDYNELLLAAQRQVLIDISATELEQRTWLESIILNLSMVPIAISRMVKGLRTRWDVEYWNNKKRDDFQTKEEYDAYNETLDFYGVLMNPDKRKDFAEIYLFKMKDHIVGKETILKRNLKEWMESREKIFFENIRSNYSLAVKHLSARKSAYEKTKTYTGEFARIQCRLLAMKHLQKFSGQTPIIDTSITLGQGAFFVIHPAQWGDEKYLVVKKLKQPSLDEPNLQYIEAHYHRKITKLGIPHTVPLLYLCMNPRNENSLWIFLPRYRQSLSEYLQANIQTIKPDQIIKIALDMAFVLFKLHSFEIVHRDFTSKNILLDDNDQCYLADFGTCKQAMQNNTLVRTYPFPPELFFDQDNAAALNYNGMAVDIYSFGILLYELLPKLQYRRPRSTQNGIDVKQLLKDVTPFYMHTNDYELLIESCLANRIEQRPTALELVEKLKRIQRILEEKICTICDTRVRKCRYHPCGHKFLCQVCHDQLKRNAENKVVCIICRQVVEKWLEDDHGQTFYLTH